MTPRYIPSPTSEDSWEDYLKEKSLTDTESLSETPQLEPSSPASEISQEPTDDSSNQ